MMNHEQEQNMKAIYRFAVAMSTRMEEKRVEGRYGWYDSNVISILTLTDMWREKANNLAVADHISTTDLVDLANFCAFLYTRIQKEIYE